MPNNVWKQLFCDRLSQRRVIRISGELLLEWLKHGTKATCVVQNALPDDAHFEGAFSPRNAPFTVDPFQPFSAGEFYVLISSSEFSPVKEGERYPDHPAPVLENIKEHTHAEEKD